MQAFERGVELTEAVADVGEGERPPEPGDPALAGRIEVPQVAVDVAVVQRRHRRPDCVGWFAATRGLHQRSRHCGRWPLVNSRWPAVRDFSSVPSGSRVLATSRA